MCENHPSAADPTPTPDLEPGRPARSYQPQVGRRSVLLGAASLGVGVAVSGLVGQLPAAAAATSDNNWPVLQSGDARLNRDFRARGVGFPGGVRRGNAAVILKYVAKRFDREIENLRDGWCWGYAYKKIGGGSVWSNHASGTALDLNAPLHPQGSSGTFNATQLNVIRAILNYCEGVVFWGGDYVSAAKDEMHFEINVGPNSPKVPRLVGKIRGLGT